MPRAVLWSKVGPHIESAPVLELSTNDGTQFLSEDNVDKTSKSISSVCWEPPISGYTSDTRNSISTTDPGLRSTRRPNTDTTTTTTITISTAVNGYPQLFPSADRSHITTHTCAKQCPAWSKHRSNISSFTIPPATTWSSEPWSPPLHELPFAVPPASPSRNTPAKYARCWGKPDDVIPQCRPVW